MRVQVLQALLVEGVHYPLGVQEIPVEKLKHKHFVKYIEYGYVVEADAMPEPKVETMKERGQRLAEKLHAAKKAAPSEAPVFAEEAKEPSMEIGEEVAPEVEAEQSEAEQKESSKKKNKQKR